MQNINVTIIHNYNIIYSFLVFAIKSFFSIFDDLLNFHHEHLNTL